MKGFTELSIVIFDLLIQLRFNSSFTAAFTMNGRRTQLIQAKLCIKQREIKYTVKSVHLMHIKTNIQPTLYVTFLGFKNTNTFNLIMALLLKSEFFFRL